MASQTHIQDMGVTLSRPWKHHDAGRQRGGRRPAGGGLISGPCCSGLHSRSWLSSCRMKVVGWGMVEVVGEWLGRAGGEGAPPDAA
jgi:hypothetical protein